MGAGVRRMVRKLLGLGRRRRELSGLREVGVGSPTVLAQQRVGAAACSQSRPGGIRILSSRPTQRLEGPPTPHSREGWAPQYRLPRRDHQPLFRGRNTLILIRGTQTPAGRHPRNPSPLPVGGTNPMEQTLPFPPSRNPVSRSQPRDLHPQPVFGLEPHAHHLRGLRTRVAVATSQLAALRVPELRCEGVAGRRRGRGRRRLQQ